MLALAQRPEKRPRMVNINDTVMLSVIGSVGGEDHYHTLHFRSLGVQSMQGLIDEWQAGCLAAYRGLFRVDDGPCSLLRAQHICGGLPLDATIEEFQTGTALAGTRGAVGDRMPSYVASLVAEKGISAGRRRQGRFFIGGMMEIDCVGNDLQTSILTPLQTYCDALRNSFMVQVSPLWRLVVHSRTEADEGGDCQGSSTLVGQLLVRTRPTTMRSRKYGHGT
jgi:hypothetical protein